MKNEKLQNQDSFWEENSKLSLEQIDSRFPKKTSEVLKIIKELNNIN